MKVSGLLGQGLATAEPGPELGVRGEGVKTTGLKGRLLLMYRRRRRLSARE